MIVNWNTRLLISQLVFSLYRVLGRSEFHQIVVVDNASTDGSRELLSALHDAELIHLIANRRQGYHGPALNQGVSWLAAHQPTMDYVWVLDSDVVILRSDVLREAVRVLNDEGAALVGQDYGGDHAGQLGIYSLLLDPTLVWQRGISPFREHGEPSAALQSDARSAGLKLSEFPFADAGHLVHIGRGTLASLARSPDANNRYSAWATERNEPHFAGVPEGQTAYMAFQEIFASEVPELVPEHLVAACLRPTLVTPRATR